MWRWVHNCCDRKTTIVSPDDDITILTDEELSRTPTKIIRLMNQVIPFQRVEVKSRSFTNYSQIVNTTRQIEIGVEKENQKDYFELVKDVLTSMTNILYGGYYEPLSERDKELADKICKLLDEISETKQNSNH